MKPGQLDALYPLRKFDPQMEPPSLDWLVEGLFQRGKINMVCGYVKSGKSRFTNYLLAGMNNGSSCGLRTKALGRVLYLCGEEPVETVNHRITTYAKWQETDLSSINIDFMTAPGLRLNEDAYQKWFMEKLPEYDLLVIDPLRRVHSANENDNSEMAPLNTAIRQWSNSLGLSMIIIHHTPKPSEWADMARMENWIRGAGDIAAIVDTAVLVSKAPGKLILTREGRFAPLPPLTVKDLGNDPDNGFCSLNAEA